MMTAACYKSGNNDESDNNEDNVCLFLRRWGLVGHMLDHLLDYVLNHMIIALVTKILQLPSFWVWTSTNK